MDNNAFGIPEQRKLKPKGGRAHAPQAPVQNQQAQASTEAQNAQQEAQQAYQRQQQSGGLMTGY